MFSNMNRRSFLRSFGMTTGLMGLISVNKLSGNARFKNVSCSNKPEIPKSGISEVFFKYGSEFSNLKPSIKRRNNGYI